MPERRNVQQVVQQHALLDVIDRLSETFSVRYSPDQVAEKVHEIHHRFQGAPIQDFVPVLVENLAHRELRD